MLTKNRTLKHCLLIAFLSAVLLMVLVLAAGSGEAEGKTITVDDDGGADYEKIQDAINASEDGDTVRVYEGLYEENISVNKRIDFIGNGSETTTIDGGGRGDVVTITADLVNMSGFTITKSGTGSSNAGVKVESDHNNIFENNCSNNYRGIFLFYSSDCTITNNTCSENGYYGIRLDDSNHNTITNNTCENNRYGIYLYRTNNCILENNTCSSNIYYGMLLGSSSNCTITNNTCSSNNDYGIRLLGSKDCILENNICSNNVYGISLDSSSDCTITNNTCSNNGFGIVLESSSYCTIEHNICSLNNYYSIYLDKSDDCILENNICSMNNGFGIVLYYSNNNTITNNTISENRVGIYLEASSRDNTAHYNNIYNNTDYGINATNNDGLTINATNNYWGAASGPYHPTKNPEGQGDNITDYVEFDPWLEEEVNWPPEAHIYSISPNPALDTDTIHFEGNGTDDGTIEAYNWRIVNETNDEVYNGTTPPAALPVGIYTIYLKTQDDYGIWSDEVSKNLIVHQKPTASITSISPSPALNTDTVNFSGEGTDDGSIVLYVWISSLDGELHNGSEANFTNSSLSIGTHTITFKVRDNYGVWSEEVTATLTVNEYIPPNKLPTVTITSPANGATLEGTVIIKGTASDPNGTVETVEILVDGEWFQATGTTNWEYELDTTKLENWDYVIKVLAFDGTDYSEDALLNITVANEKEGDGDGEAGFLPGFKIAAFLVGAVVGVAGWRRRKKT